MALDAAVARAVREALAPMTLRVYGWREPSLSLGAFQRLEGMDLVFLSRRKIPVVRRPTGGRAILHVNELTYSFSSRYEGPFRAASLFDCYRIISAAIEDALRRAGVPAEICRERRHPGTGHPGPAAHAALNRPAAHAACFESVSYGEITVKGRKLVGSAQRRWPEGFLQQGSIPFEIDEALHRNVFSNYRSGRMASVNEASQGQYPVCIKNFKSIFKDAFTRAFGGVQPPLEGFQAQEAPREAPGVQTHPQGLQTQSEGLQALQGGLQAQELEFLEELLPKYQPCFHRRPCY